TLREFLFDRLYEGPRIAAQTARVRALVESLWEAATSEPRRFDMQLERESLGFSLGTIEAQGDLGQAFVDVIASMTDRQASRLAMRLRGRRPAWSVLLPRRQTIFSGTASAGVARPPS